MNSEFIFNETFDFDTDQNQNKIHLRIKQRNGRKSVTTVENLPSSINIEQLAKTMRGSMHCISSVIKSDSGEKVIQLSGDQRAAIKKYLIDNNISTEELIIVHGY